MRTHTILVCSLLLYAKQDSLFSRTLNGLKPVRRMSLMRLQRSCKGPLKHWSCYKATSCFMNCQFFHEKTVFMIHLGSFMKQNTFTGQWEHAHAPFIIHLPRVILNPPFTVYYVSTNSPLGIEFQEVILSIRQACERQAVQSTKLFISTLFAPSSLV